MILKKFILLRLYQIRYIKRYHKIWVVDDNRKLYIGKEIERIVGVNLETRDVTHLYDLQESEQMVTKIYF